MQKFNPIGNRVLVQRLPDETVSPGGIIIPDNLKEKPIRGIVKAVGPGTLNKNGMIIPMEVQVADVILFPKYAGNNVKLDDSSDLLIMVEDEILAILREE